MTAVDDEVRTCHWHNVAIVRRPVLIGAPPGEPFTMWIGVDPDDEGEVIELASRPGLFRYLHPDQRQLRDKDRFRIHGSKSCAPESERS